MSYKKTIGRLGEQLAKEYLLKKNFILLAENYYINHGEIDLIMKKDDILHFVEVKTRIMGEEYYNLYDLLTIRKKNALKKTSLVFLQEYSYYDISYEYDLLVVLLDKYKKLKEILYYENVDLYS